MIGVAVALAALAAVLFTVNALLSFVERRDSSLSWFRLEVAVFAWLVTTLIWFHTA